MKKIISILIIVMLAVFSFFFIRSTLLKNFFNDQLTDVNTPKIEYIYALFESGPVRYEENSFVPYEEVEKHFKSYGAFDLEENLFSLIHRQTHQLYRLSGDFILDQNENKIATFKVEDNTVYVKLEEFLGYFGVNVVKEKDLSEEQIEEYGNSKPKTDAELGLYQLRNANYIAAWDTFANDTSLKFHKDLDVVIPKWLGLKTQEGNFNSYFDSEYYQNVKNQQKEIWVLASNSFDPDMTSLALNSYKARTNMVNSLVKYAKENEMDGVNIDFENMHLEDSDLFVQFIAELNNKLVEEDKLLSVCVTVPGGSANWSLVYDRERIAQNCDYLTLMAYDQHWENSQTVGPVAAYSWVEEHLEEMLKTIPSNKIILGLPFYTRVWNESFSTEEPNKIKVRSRSVYMPTPSNLLNGAKNVTKVWDESAKQNFYVYYDSTKNEMVKFWYDDIAAVSQKATLAKDKNLSGVAAWSLGFEAQGIWEELSAIIK